MNEGKKQGKKWGRVKEGVRHGKGVVYDGWIKKGEEEETGGGEIGVRVSLMNSHHMGN